MIPNIQKVKAFLIFIFLPLLLDAQAPERYNASEIYLRLNKLNVLGSALYIAAHPDDENTRLISWLANEKLINTAYLSLTRGDGGQNLIGSEIGPYLGVIRTQELLQARKIDRGQQFFSSARDFGYSKSAEETFNIWDREKVLADMVWVIRSFKPDVLITRFSSKPGGTHGHHTASAILAEEAFKAAGDKKRFPEQLEHVSVWQPARLLWNTSWWFYGNEDNFDKSGLLPVDVGTYNPLLGKSYNEMAAVSRSMHKSQGFGASLERGSSIEYLKPILGDKNVDDLFHGINTSWTQIKGGTEIASLIESVIKKFDPERPELITADLVNIYKKIEALPDNDWKERKMEEVKVLIKASLGLYLDATSLSKTSAPGEALTVVLEAVNRSDTPVVLVSLKNDVVGSDTLINHSLKNNIKFEIKQSFKIPAAMGYTQPYWLKEEGTLGMFAQVAPMEVGKPEAAPAKALKANISIMEQPFTFSIPVVFKQTDPVKGETYQPFEITPPIFMNLANDVFVFPNGASKSVRVLVTASSPVSEAALRLDAGEGWKVSPEYHAVNISQPGGEKTYTFTLSPPTKPSEEKLRAVLTMDGKEYSKSKVAIEYDHIPHQYLYPEANAKLVKLDIKKKGEKIGYIMGAGDDIPASLEQIGYKVEILNNVTITKEKLQQFDAVILGVRAYNTVDRLKIYQPTLMEYVKEGGTMIVQYNTNSGLVTDNLGPYPFNLSRDRVTVEEAEVKILEPGHPLMNVPNKITQDDFTNWVQERGLYFPNSWSNEYVALLSSHDPGESPKNGGLLVASYGKGYYIYTGYSWFRELPAGVPGAYRIFTNMISIGK